MTRTDTAPRVVDAPVEQAYAALVDPAALVQWLPPRGMTGRFEHADIRPGGSYRLELVYDDAPAGGGKTSAASDVVDVRFVALVPGARVVQAVDFVSDDAAFAGTMTMTWELAAVGAATLVTVRANDVPPGIGRDDHEAGMRASLDQLADYLHAG